LVYIHFIITILYGVDVTKINDSVKNITAWH